MSVSIIGVTPGSPAARKQIASGDILLSINAHTIRDVLDYQFYAAGETLTLALRQKQGGFRLLRIRKAEQEDLGLQFESYLMDKQQHCKNKCLFCFIDQLPPGMRESLYFKDDDARLSFLFGNYITLTNLSDADVQRMIEMHISPVNVSVHTMNPQLRVSMMGNPHAGEKLSYLRRFADAGIKINAQLVLCPGVNDGRELRDSLEQLATLFPALQSISAVPVGITKYRATLPKLTPFNRDGARQVIQEISDFNSRFLCYNGTTLAFAADEFYLLAGQQIPQAEEYGEFHQLENGVGMWALFRAEFMRALQERRAEPAQARRVSIATGLAAYPLFLQLAQQACEAFAQLQITVHPIKNDFFGEHITVAGLLTGGDLMRQLENKDLGDALLLSATMLRAQGDMLLDNVTPEQLEAFLHVPIHFIPNDAACFLDALLDA